MFIFIIKALSFLWWGSKHIMQYITMMIEKLTNKTFSKAWYVTFICQKDMFSRMLILLSFLEKKK